MTAERYATIAQLQDRLTSRSSATAAVTLALADASDAVERYCGRVFTLDAATSARIYIPSSHDTVDVDDIGDSSTISVATGFDGINWTSVASTLWWTLPLNATVRSFPVTQIVGPNTFPVYVRPTVQVTAKWGWPAVPATVTEATLLLASRLYSRRESPTGVAGFGDYGVVRVTGSDADVASMLNGLVRQAF